MVLEQHSCRVQPSLAFTNAIPNSKEKEVYIDGTLYADGMVIDQREQGAYRVKERQHKKYSCKQLLRFIRKLWATQQTEKIDIEEDNEKYVRTTLRELFIYMVFLGVLTIVVFGMVSSNMHTLTQALKGVFVDSNMLDESTNSTGPSFTELTRMEEFWDYMTQTVPSGLFTENWYNARNVSNYGYILHENRLLGAVRMHSSSIFASKKTFEDKYSYGPCANLEAENCTEDPFKYTPHNSIVRSSTTGKVGVYDEGGFMKIFGSSQEEFKREVNELKD
ncbi:unnamed protein product, partial [Rotaria socialis]